MLSRKLIGQDGTVSMLLAALFLAAGAASSLAQPGQDATRPKKTKSDTQNKTAVPGDGQAATSQKADKTALHANGAKDSNHQQAPEPRHEPTYAEILKKLQEETRDLPRPITPPAGHGGIRRTVPAPNPDTRNAIRPVVHKLLPDGSRLVDRPGRLAREGDYFTFAFESRGRGAPEVPMRLLPNRLLEDMEIVSAGGTKPIVFVISGEVTEYRGVNYLLVQKLLVRPSLGNLK